jgi:hypothetical protein
MFSRLDFTYDAERDVYLCPNGKPLRTSGTVHDGRVRNYLSHPGDCRVCNLKERCTRAPFRKVARDINEEARDHARSLKGTPEFEQSSNERKKVEMRFAHLKVHHGFERMRLRGLTGARDEFHLAAIVQNLKTLANHAWHPPPYKEAACARVSISVQVASRVSQLPLRGAAVSNQGQNRPSKHQKVSLTPLLVGFINGIDPERKFASRDPHSRADIRSSGRAPP